MEHEHDPIEADLQAEAQAFAPNGKVADGYDLPEPPPPAKAVTAFIVIVKEDGSCTGSADINMPLELDRAATLNDMYSGCAHVMRDVEIMQTTTNVVQNVINGMMQVAQAQMQAAQDQQIAQQVLTPNRAMRRH